MATFRFRSNRWQVQIRRKGHPALTRSFLMKKDAEAWARQVEAAQEREEALPTISRSTAKVTLGSLVERYRDTVSYRKKGGDVERIVLTAFLRHEICQKWLDLLTASDFARYRDERLESVCANTLRREFSTLHHLFEIARDEWGVHLSTNPLDKVRMGKPSPHRERRLQPGEEDRLLASASQCRSPLIKVIIELALSTGMRRGELLALRWEDVDQQNRSAVIRDPKNNTPRHVPLSRRALKLLGSIERGDGRVFPISPNAFRLTWERVRRRAMLNDLHFHDLRHEAVSRFFEIGLTAPEVASISGHRDPRMLFRYAHPMRSRVLQILDRDVGN